MTGPREPRSRGDRPAKPPLSRAAIVEAGLEVVQRDGLGAVTLRKVAQRLDTGPASLYVYVTNRDNLLERMLDRALAEVPLAAVDPGHWQQQLTGLFRATLDALCRYPGLARVALGSIPAWPSALAITENALALMRAGKIPDQAAAWAADALYLLTVATAVEHGIECAVRPPHRTTSRRPPTTAEPCPSYTSLPADRYPAITSMAATLTQGDDAQRFAFAIKAIINGARTG